MLKQALHCSLLKCRVHCFQPWVRPLYVFVLCYEREKVMELAWAGGDSSAAHKGLKRLGEFVNPKEISLPAPVLFFLTLSVLLVEPG